MKFGDVIICVASIAVIFALIHAALDMVFVSALGLTVGYPVAIFVGFFLSALGTGYIFAGKIWEARREAMAKTMVLWAVFVILVLKFEPTQAHWGLFAEEAYQGQYGTALSTVESLHWEMMYLDIFTFIFVAVALVLGFAGLYVGSTLKRPGKS